MLLHTARGHLMEFPIAKSLSVRQDSMEMQLHSTVMNGKSAAHGDAIPALRYSCFFLVVSIEDEPGAPTHSYSRMAIMAILRKLSKPKVTLFHACAIFLLIISKV